MGWRLPALEHVADHLSDTGVSGHFASLIEHADDPCSAIRDGYLVLKLDCGGLLAHSVRHPSPSPGRLRIGGQNLLGRRLPHGAAAVPFLIRNSKTLSHAALLNWNQNALRPASFAVVAAGTVLVSGALLLAAWQGSVWWHTGAWPPLSLQMISLWLDRPLPTWLMQDRSIVWLEQDAAPVLFLVGAATLLLGTLPIRIGPSARTSTRQSVGTQPPHCGAQDANAGLQRAAFDEETQALIARMQAKFELLQRQAPVKSDGCGRRQS